MLPINSGAVTVGTSYTSLYEYPSGGGYATCVVSVHSAAGSAASLSDFRLSVKAHEDDDFEPIVGTSDWGAGTTDTVVFCTATVPNTLAADKTALVKFAIGGYWAIRLDAKVAADTATITVRGTMV